MNKDKIEDLIQKSILRTSDEFTQKLMERIELKKQQAMVLHRAVILTCILCGILLIVIFYVPSGFNFIQSQIKLPSLLLKIIGAMFVFTILNKLLSLKGELD